MSAQHEPGKDPMQAAVDEIRREARDAAAELRVELGDAGMETREALRDAMRELRDAMREAFSGAPGPAEPPGSGARLSRAERKEMTRELLLDAAVEVFAQKGYHGASLDDVAEAAGFTKGAVYSNFSRKADLFQALLERESARRNEAIRQGMEAVPLDLWPELASELLREQGQTGQDWDILVVEFWLAAVRDPAVRATLCAGREQVMDELGATIDRKLRGAGVDPGFTGRELANLLDALGSGMLMSRYLDRSGAEPELFARAVRKLLADEPDVPSG